LVSIHPQSHHDLPHQDQEPADQGICERFHKTVLNEFCRVAFRKKVYRSIDELQTDLDLWVREYNEVHIKASRPVVLR
jgi:transposase InsO family protein